MRISDEDLITKCKEIDFSADSQNFEANLEKLKSKLTQPRAGTKSRKTKRPIAIIAAAVAALSLSVVAFGDTIVQLLDVIFIQGEEYVSKVWEMESDGRARHFGIAIDSTIGSPIVINIDGHEHVIRDEGVFYDLEEALGYLHIQHPLLPTWLPPGYAFDRVVFSLDPRRHNVQMYSRAMNIFYTDGENELRLNIMHFHREDGEIFLPFNTEYVNIDIRARADTITAAVGDGFLGVPVNDTVYIFESDLLTRDEFVRIAQSMWRDADAIILRGNERALHFDADAVATNHLFMDFMLDPDAQGTIFIDDGQGNERLIQDLHVFDDLDEALEHFPFGNVIRPSYLPPGYAFKSATFTISPVRHPDIETAGQTVTIIYSNGEDIIKITIMYWPANMAATNGMPVWIDGLAYIEVNGSPGSMAMSERAGLLQFTAGDVAYIIQSNGLTAEKIIRIADSIKE